MDVLVSLVESPASFYVQFIGEDYYVSSTIAMVTVCYVLYCRINSSLWKQL